VLRVAEVMRLVLVCMEGKVMREKLIHSIKSTRYRSSVSSSPRRFGSASRGRRSRSGKLVVVVGSIGKVQTCRSKGGTLMHL